MSLRQREGHEEGRYREDIDGIRGSFGVGRKGEKGTFELLVSRWWVGKRRKDHDTQPRRIDEAGAARKRSFDQFRALALAVRSWLAALSFVTSARRQMP